MKIRGHVTSPMESLKLTRAGPTRPTVARIRQTFVRNHRTTIATCEPSGQTNRSLNGRIVGAVLVILTVFQQVRSWFIVALACAWPTISSAQDPSRTIARASSPTTLAGRFTADTATLYLPFVNVQFDALNRPGLRHRVTINRAGRLTYDSRQVTSVELATMVAANKSDEYIETKIAPNGDSLYGQVVKVIKIFNEANDFEYAIEGNQEFAEIFEIVAPLSASPATVRPYLLRPIDLPIYVDRVNARGGCTVSLAGRLMNSEMFRKGAYDALDRTFKAGLVGGDEKDRSALPLAMIEGKAQTPWKCIGGTVYNTQISGIPTIVLAAFY